MCLGHVSLAPPGSLGSPVHCRTAQALHRRVRLQSRRVDPDRLATEVPTLGQEVQHEAVGISTSNVSSSYRGPRVPSYGGTRSRRSRRPRRRRWHGTVRSTSAASTGDSTPSSPELESGILLLTLAIDLRVVVGASSRGERRALRLSLSSERIVRRLVSRRARRALFRALADTRSRQFAPPRSLPALPRASAVPRAGGIPPRRGGAFPGGRHPD